MSALGLAVDSLLGPEQVEELFQERLLRSFQEPLPLGWGAFQFLPAVKRGWRQRCRLQRRLARICLCACRSKTKLCLRWCAIRLFGRLRKQLCSPFLLLDWNLAGRRVAIENARRALNMSGLGLAAACGTCLTLHPTLEPEQVLPTLSRAFKSGF